MRMASQTLSQRMQDLARSRTTRSRSTRISNSTTRTKSRSRSSFQNVQHEANKQRDARLQKMMQIRPLFTSTLIN